MKKERLITRTITSTNCSVLCYDLTSGQIAHKDFTVSGDFTKVSDDEKLAFIREAMEKREKVSVIKVDALVAVKRKYAIAETDFLKYAHVMTKEEEAENSEEEEG